MVNRMLLISVIICTKNNEKTLEECLKSVRENSPPETIIVDGCSSDKTSEIAREYTDKILSDGGRGLAFARQLGAENAKEDYISYTDADTIVPKGCYERMLKELKEKKWAGIHASLISPENTNYWEWAEDEYTRFFVKPGEDHRIGTIVTVYDKALVLKYKFDPFFIRTSEDQDLCYRMRKAGHKFGYSKEIAYHRHRSDFRSFFKQKFQYGEGNARLALKHKSLFLLISPFLYIPYGVLISARYLKFRLIPYFLLTGIFTIMGMFNGLWALIRKKI